MAAQQSKDEEVRRLQEDAFKWMNGSFCTWPRRQRIKSVLDHVAINNAVANSVKVRLRTKLNELVANYSFQTFYPLSIISYSTGNRADFDAPCAGPGLLVVSCVLNHVLEKGYPCYSDILTPAGRNWREDMERIKKARVMVVMMSQSFFRSVHCLREVAAAIRSGVELIPIRCDEHSVNGIDISRDRGEMWPFEELAKYAKHQDNLMGVLEELRLQREEPVEKLSSIGSIPAHRTILSEATAVDELVSGVGDFVTPVSLKNDRKRSIVVQESEQQEI